MPRRVKPSGRGDAAVSRAEGEYPYPIRDWRDANAYPKQTAFDAPVFSKDTLYPPDRPIPDWAEKRWAWEFLRRNSDYQKTAAEHPEKVWKEISGGDLMEKLIDSGPMKNGAELFKRFGLPIFLDPKVDSPHPAIMWYFVQRWSATPATPDFEDRLREIRELRRPDTLLVELHLSQPLPPQLRQVQDLFDMESSAMSSMGVLDKLPARRRRFDRYPLYLRILDAKAARATNREIAAVVYPSRKTVQDADKLYAGQSVLEKDLRAARELVSGGYRHIPTL